MSINMPFMPSPRGGLPHGYTNGYAGGSGAQPHVGSVPANPAQGFMFRSRNERIDWKKIASIDVDRIMRDFDVSSLQDSIMGITFCDIEREIDTRMVDQNFVTVFKLAQLIIQYLLHSQEVMAHNTSIAEERVQQLHADHEATKMELSRLGEELNKVKQESHKRKKLLKNQQSLIQATANNYHKCMYCQKAFFNLAYLQTHMQRRHPEFTPRPPQDDDNATARKVNEVSKKLEKDLEELRERLKFSESQVAEERERAQEQIKMVLQQKQDINKGDAQRNEEQHRKELERWKHEQLNFQKVEMEKMQNMFMKELKEMHDKYTSSQTALENIQSKLGKQSMLGKIIDEDELEDYKRRNKKQEKEMGRLKEELQAEISTVQNQMSADLKKKEDEWRKKQKDMKSHHKEEVKELKALLKQTKELLDIEREGGDKKGAKYQKQLQDLLKKNKDVERQLKVKDEKIKELKVKASKHYEVVEPRSSPPPRMTIPTSSQMEPPTDEEEDTSQVEGLDTLSRVLQESESWLTGTHPSYNLSNSDIADEELDGMNGHESQDELHTFAKNKDRIVEGLKEELTSALQRNMAKRGVPEGMRGISAQSLENKVRILKQERQQLAKQHSKFYDIRERFKREVDRKAAEMRRTGTPLGNGRRSASPQKMKAVTPTPQSKVSSKGKPAAKQQQQKKNQHHQQQRHQQQQQQQRQQPKQQPKQQPQPAIKKLSPGQVRTGPPVAARSPALNDGRGQGKGVAPKGRANTPKSNARVSFEDESEEDEEEEEEESEEEESESFEEEEEPEDYYKSPNVPPRPAPHPQPTTNGFHHGNTEGDEDDSEWDSEEISELEERKDKPAPAPKPVTSVRQPQGPMVSSLTRSIELQLSGRRQGQKPVGGVDLGAGTAKPPQPAPRTPSPSPTPRIPTIPDARQQDDDDDFDDSGSLSVSSLGDSFSGLANKPTSPTPAPRTGKKSNDTDMSSNTYNTSMWGSSKAKGTGTGKSSLVSVTDFDDDDDDFDIDDLS